MEIGRSGFIKSLAGMTCLSAFGGEVKSTNVQVRVFKVNGGDGKYKYVEWWGVSITRNDGVYF